MDGDDDARRTPIASVASGEKEGTSGKGSDQPYLNTYRLGNSSALDSAKIRWKPHSGQSTPYYFQILKCEGLSCMSD